MSEFIYFDIPVAVRQASEAYFGVLLRGAREYFPEAISKSEWSSALELFQALEPVGLDRLASYATPQLWLYIRRVYSAISNDPNSLSPLVKSLSAAAFDSFWSLLPEGISVRMQSSGSGEIVLPNVGIRLTTTTADLGRIGDQPAMRVDGVLVPINECRAGSRLDIAKVKFSSASVVAEESNSLFDEFSFLSVSGHATPAQLLACQLDQAFKVICEVSPFLAGEIARRIKWFVPLKSLGPRIHSSHTSLLLPGAMFLSRSDDPVELAEAMIHEFGHNDLNGVENVYPLLLGLDEEKYYSPWRKDRRPLRGLIHALYVFCAVASFFKLLESLEENRRRRLLQNRRAIVVHRLNLGMKQIPDNHLTAWGESLRKLFSFWIEKCGDDLEQTIPAVITDHWQQWRAENPDLPAAGPTGA